MIEKVHRDVKVGLEPRGFVIRDVQKDGKDGGSKDCESSFGPWRIFLWVDAILSCGGKEGLDGAGECVKDDLIVDGALEATRPSGRKVARDEARNQRLETVAEAKVSEDCAHDLVQKHKASQVPTVIKHLLDRRSHSIPQPFVSHRFVSHRFVLWSVMALTSLLLSFFLFFCLVPVPHKPWIPVNGVLDEGVEDIWKTDDDARHHGVVEAPHG